MISSQGDPIRPVYNRATSQTRPDYPPKKSDDDFVPLFTYLQSNCSQHCGSVKGFLPRPVGRNCRMVQKRVTLPAHQPDAQVLMLR
jgi:hypothetical protein